MLSKITSWRHSKIIAFVLAVAVFLTAFYAISPVISFADGNDSTNTNTVKYWDGITSEETFDVVFDGNNGDGLTEATAYEITTGDQLYRAVRTKTGLYFKIMNDICLQPEAKIGDFEAAVLAKTAPTEPLAWNTAAYTAAATGSFAGHIDGNGHTIRGLYANGTGTKAAGLIANVCSLTDGTASTIKNITVDTAYIVSAVEAGGIVGVARQQSKTSLYFEIEGCNVINSYICSTNSASYPYAGGIIGHFWTGKQGTVTNCAVYGNYIDAPNVESPSVGAILGNIPSNPTVGLQMKNCFADGIVVGDTQATQKFTYDNVYTTKEGSPQSYASTTVDKNAIYLTDAEAKGYALPGINHLTGWKIEDGKYPAYVGKDNAPAPQGPTNWNGKKTNRFEYADGETGDEDKPYSIYYPFQLYAALQDDTGKHYVLKNDIYLNTPEVTNANANSWHLWVEKGEDSNAKIFSGTLDGDGHTIYGYRDLTYSDNNELQDNFSEINCQYGVGLIPVASDATITNLHLRDVYINSWSKFGTGAFISTATGKVEISGCSVTDAVIEGRRVASAFVGTLKEGASADISESVFQGTLTKRRHESDTDIEEGIVGGFVGNAGTASITLADVIANKYKLVGYGGTLEATSAYAIGNNIENETGVNNSFSTYNGLKYKLRTNTAELSAAFYWDNVNQNTSPLLKNRKATQDKDIDGNGATELDEADVLALSNIVLFATEDKPAINYVTLSDGNVNGYNDISGVDITDIVSVYNAVTNTNN